MLQKWLHGYLEGKQANIRRLAQRKNNTKMNLMKAYAILAVVCSHTGGGAVVFPMSNWAAPAGYFMQLFVFVSGYFYKERNDEAGYFGYLKGKVRTLVVPYFGWNLVYGLLNQLFRNLGVVHYGQPISLYSFFVKPWIDGHQYYFMVPAWFLLSLFLVTAVHFSIRKLLCRLGEWKEWALLAVTVLGSMVCVHLSQAGFTSGWIRCVLRAGFLLPYYQLGYVYQKQEQLLVRKKGCQISVLILTLLALWIAAGEDGISINVIGGAYVGSPLIVTLFSVAAILLTAAVCETLAPAFAENRLIHAIGNNTFTIMMHHGFVIFCVNLLLYLLRVPDFNVEQFRKVLWYVYPWRDSRVYLFYVAACVLLPLLFRHCGNQLVMRYRQRSR